MIVQCTICSDLISPTVNAENIVVTKCGHMFHHDCLLKWITRSQTCPQCRQRITSNCMFRVYPNTANTGPVDEEVVANLQNELDLAKLTINEQNKMMKIMHDDNVTLEEQIKKTENTVKGLRKKIMNSEAAINASTEQIQFLKTENKELKKVKNELEAIKEKLSALQGLEMVLNGTTKDVEAMLKEYTDIRQVCTFATALKQALYESENKKNQARNSLQEVKVELQREKTKNEQWQLKVAKLEESLAIMTKTVEDLKNKKVDDRKDVDVFVSDDSFKLLDSPENKPTTNLSTLVSNIENADSPYLNLKQSSLGWAGLKFSNNYKNDITKNKSVKQGYIKPLSTVVPGSSRSFDLDLEISPIHFKNTNCNQNTDPIPEYDGMGGHSKVTNIIPKCLKLQPIKPKSSIPKLTGKHKLKRPNPEGNQDIVNNQDIRNMLKKKREQ